MWLVEQPHQQTSVGIEHIHNIAGAAGSKQAATVGEVQV